jgi:two-component system cell cycle sensor histidine kinase/response regulator CckA
MLHEIIRVLVVEDNPGDAERLTMDLMAMSPSGSSVSIASTLAEAIVVLKAGAFDVVIADLGLPDSRGLATLVGLRRACVFGSIIVVTGFDETELGAHAVREGAADFLSKGDLDARTLSRSVRFAMERLRRRRAEHELSRVQKLDAVNRLAYGVSHHFNNLLTVIIGNGHLIRDAVQGAEAEVQLADLLEAADRARVLALHLVSFCENGQFDPPDGRDGPLHLLAREREWTRVNVQFPAPARAS